MNDQAADLTRTPRKEEAHEDLQEVRVGCESCGALLSVSFFVIFNVRYQQIRRWVNVTPCDC